MATALSGIEIVDIAKKIETCGEAFYDAAVEHVDDPEVRKLFTWLRNEERRHETEFENLLSHVEEADGDWRDNEEYAGYMRSLAEYRVFPDPEAARALVTASDGPAAVLRHAMNFEKDSILFLHEMRPLIREEDRQMVDRLLDEERKHLRMLTELHEQLGKD
jgi:rubrerythrin